MMPTDNPRGIGFIRRWGLVICGALLVLIVGFTLVLRGHLEIPAPPSDSSASPSSADQDLVVREYVESALPATLRAASGEFYAETDRSYLVELEISVTKLADTPGAEMYLGFSLNCSGTENGVSGSAGGTQNFITGETSVVSNQMVLESSGDGKVACNVLLNSPNPEAAAAGATFVADAQWRVTPIDGMASESVGGDRLPRAVDSGGRDVVLSSTVDIDELNGSDFDALVSLHLTTCSTVNGSQENGKFWCDEAHVDNNGSSYDVILRADLVREDGTPCQNLGVISKGSHLDEDRHHQMISLRDQVSVPGDTCGSSVRITTTVDNKGPAPLVVHGAASSQVVAQI